MELSKELAVRDFTETIKCYIVHIGYGGQIFMVSDMSN